MISKFTISLTLLVLLGPAILAQSSSCNSEPKGGEYKVLYEVDAGREQKEKHLYIYIPPKRFTVAAMIKVIHRIRCNYIDQKALWVVLYDTRNPKAAYSESGHILESVGSGPTRGLYEFNSEKEELSFRSTDRGEIRIEFGRGRYCVFFDQGDGT